MEVPWEQKASKLFWSRKSFRRAGKTSEAFWTPRFSPLPFIVKVSKIGKIFGDSVQCFTLEARRSSKLVRYMGRDRTAGASRAGSLRLKVCRLFAPQKPGSGLRSIWVSSRLRVVSAGRAANQLLPRLSRGFLSRLKVYS